MIFCFMPNSRLSPVDKHRQVHVACLRSGVSLYDSSVAAARRAGDLTSSIRSTWTRDRLDKELDGSAIC